MRLEPDYKELLKLLNKHKVKYCIVGAFAVAYYSLPRFTKDLDILIEPSSENARKIVKALKDFGFESLNLTENDFTKEKEIIQLGYEPVRIDLITSIAGLDFDEVWKHKKIGAYGKEKIYFIGLNDLIINKKALSRMQDKADIKVLLAAKKRRKKQ